MKSLNTKRQRGTIKLYNFIKLLFSQLYLHLHTLKEKSNILYQLVQESMQVAVFV